MCRDLALKKLIADAMGFLLLKVAVPVLERAALPEPTGIRDEHLLSP